MRMGGGGGLLSVPIPNEIDLPPSISVGMGPIMHGHRRSVQSYE